MGLFVALSSLGSFCLVFDLPSQSCRVGVVSRLLAVEGEYKMHTETKLFFFGKTSARDFRFKTDDVYERIQKAEEGSYIACKNCCTTG